METLEDSLRLVLNGKKILLGVTGSIAAFKICDLVRLFVKCGAEVKVILTSNAKEFVTPLTLETLSGNPVVSEVFAPESGAPGTHHIGLARWADLFIVAPATANSIAKIANGIADDLLTTEFLAFRGPVLIAPAMNPAMYAAPATERNLSLLKSYGYFFSGPTVGDTACGEVGFGRMLEPWSIAIDAASVLLPKTPNTALLTFGSTKAPIDPVRAITNHSSGKMGLGLIWALLARGYQVTAVAGVLSPDVEAALPRSPYFPMKILSARTPEEMYGLTTELALSKNWDIVICSAAVLDWTILQPSQEKLKKKNDESSHLDLRLQPTKDILKTLAEYKRSGAGITFILGFAAETANGQELLNLATEKLRKKDCDAIFANDVSLSTSTFGGARNSGALIFRSGKTLQLPPTTKPQLARLILEEISSLEETRLTNDHPIHH